MSPSKQWTVGVTVSANHTGMEPASVVGPWGPPTPIQSVPRALSREQNGRDVEQTTCLQQLQQLKMCGAIPPRQNAFIPWRTIRHYSHFTASAGLPYSRLRTTVSGGRIVPWQFQRHYVVFLKVREKRTEWCALTLATRPANK
jgi:hypothetical protein